MDVIAAIYGNEKDRERNFREFLECLANQTRDDFNVYIVEQYADRAYYRELVKNTYRYSYIAIQGEPFSLPWCFNVGIKQSDSDLLVFMGSGGVFGDKFIESMMDFPDDYGVGWNELLYLNEIGTQEYISMRKTMHYHNIEYPWNVLWDYCNKAEFKQRKNRAPLVGGSCGFAMIFKRSLISEKLGGFNENFVNWGGDEVDMAQRAKAATGIKVHSVPNNVIHLHHKSRLPRSDYQSNILYGTTVRKPLEVSALLLNADLGNPDHRTEIDVSDLVACMRV